MVSSTSFTKGIDLQLQRLGVDPNHIGGYRGLEVDCQGSSSVFECRIYNQASTNYYNAEVALEMLEQMAEDFFGDEEKVLDRLEDAIVH